LPYGYIPDSDSVIPQKRSFIDIARECNSLTQDNPSTGFVKNSFIYQKKPEAVNRIIS